MVKVKDSPWHAAGEDGSVGDSVDNSSPFRPAGAPQDTTGDKPVGDEPNWLGIARDAYEDSTRFMESSLRWQWERNERAFQSRHPAGSKYLSDDFKHRSKLFRPKTRAMIRTGEAAVAQAFFANEDVVGVQATDPSNKEQVAAADFHKELLQYRLTTPNKKIGIPWFINLVGAYQDAPEIRDCVLQAILGIQRA